MKSAGTWGILSRLRGNRGAAKNDLLPWKLKGYFDSECALPPIPQLSPTYTYASLGRSHVITTTVSDKFAAEIPSEGRARGERRNPNATNSVFVIKMRIVLLSHL